MATDPRIREAREDEAAVVRDVIVRAFSEYQGMLDPPSGAHAETVDSVRSKMTEGGALVCETDGVVAGCVLYAAEPGFLYVGRLAVIPAYRSRGIGDLLMHAAERRAVELGLSRVRLGVRLPLTRLRAFYEARGYVVIATSRHPGYTVETSLEMEKALGDA